jgi:hypothetical protein
MKKLIRGLLIDPIAKTVTEVQASDELPFLYTLLDCRTVEAIRITDRDFLWMDEEGLYAKPAKPFFSFSGQIDRPYCGKALILGFKRDESAATSLPLALVERNVVWRDLVYDGISIKDRVVGNITVIEQHARFKPRGGND